MSLHTTWDYHVLLSRILANICLLTHKSNTGSMSFMLPVKFRSNIHLCFIPALALQKWCLPWCLQKMRVQACSVIPFSKCLYRQIVSSVSGVLCQRQCFCEISPLAFNFHKNVIHFASLQGTRVQVLIPLWRVTVRWGQGSNVSH